MLLYGIVSYSNFSTYMPYGGQKNTSMWRIQLYEYVYHMRQELSQYTVNGHLTQYK